MTESIPLCEGRRLFFSYCRELYQLPNACSTASVGGYLENEKFFFSPYNLAPAACSNSELTSEIINHFRHFAGLLVRGLLLLLFLRWGETMSLWNCGL
jgi:hypothetical protein